MECFNLGFGIFFYWMLCWDERVSGKNAGCRSGMSGGVARAVGASKVCVGEIDREEQGSCLEMVGVGT